MTKLNKALIYILIALIFIIYVEIRVTLLNTQIIESQIESKEGDIYILERITKCQN